MNVASIFQIDPDIRRARTLASEFYTDERYFEMSRDKIFARSWHFLGRTDDFATLTPATILPGYLGEPVLIVKNGERVHCLSNVCTHRGKILVDEPCDAKLIRCGYHGRRFSLDGKFLSMPEFEGVDGFPSESDDLTRISVATHGDFVFASIDPAASFEDFAGDALPLFKDVAGMLELTETREYEVNAHWALYCENYLEGFHIPYVHHGLNAIVDYGSYATQTFRYSSLQTALSEPGTVVTGAFDGGQIKTPVTTVPGSDKTNTPVTTVPGSDKMVAAQYLFIFPNMMFNFYPWGVSVNIVRPVSPSRTVIEFYTYVGDASLIDKSAGADLHGVEMEDEAVVESVQKGIRSRFYSHGRYSPAQEQGTHHFQRLIAEFLG
jgi:choline monooxygenase